MTYNELRAEVCALGFETEIEAEDRLLFATKRALSMLFTERPLYKILSFAKPKLTPVFKLDVLEHRGGRADSFPFNARSYSFITSGVGHYTVTDGSGSRSVEFGPEQRLHRDFLHGSGKIEFFGELFYTVYSLAFFDELYGTRREDIPLLDGIQEYRIKDYADDFLACTSLPQNERGEVIEGASVSAGFINIPSDYCGRILLKYKAVPRCSLENGDEPLLLPDGCEPLLPLLVSAYVWLDDAPEKAEYYMMLYRDGMAAVRAYNRGTVDTEYTVKDGWA